MSVYLTYAPSIPGNAALIGIFALSLLLHLFFGIKYRKWGLMVAVVIGTAGEIAGYVARIVMNIYPACQTWFLVNLLALTVGPAFLTAAIYLCFAEIVVIYGEKNSSFRPRTYTMVFCTFDFVAVALQAIGGALGSVSTSTTRQMGGNIMLVGLGLQILSLIIFAITCIEFMVRMSRTHDSMLPLPSVTTTPLFFGFSGTLAVATFAFFVRSVYRVVELCHGFKSHIANNQISFMLLDSAMVAIAVVALTILHPGLCLGGQWQGSDYEIRRSRSTRRTDKGFKAEDGKCNSATSLSSGTSELTMSKGAPKDKEVSVEVLGKVQSKAPAPVAVPPTPAYASSEQKIEATGTTEDDYSSIYSTETHRINRRAVQAAMARPGRISVEMGPLFSVPYEYTPTSNSIGAEALLGLPYESTRRDLPEPFSLT